MTDGKAYTRAYGRYPMYIASAIIYLLMFVPIGAARNIVSRQFLAPDTLLLPLMPLAHLSGDRHHRSLHFRGRRFDRRHPRGGGRRRTFFRRRPRPADVAVQFLCLWSQRFRTGGMWIRRAQKRLAMDTVVPGSSFAFELQKLQQLTLAVLR